VTLDKEVRFKTHLADKAGKATRVALALRRMKGLQPKAVKQLAQSAVLPVADYASPIWSPIATHDMKQLLQQSQRITAQAVIRGFRTVALSVAELEAGLLPLEQRLRKQAIAFWVSIHKLGQSHPHWMIKRQRLCTKHRSPLMRIAEMCEDVRVDGILEVKAYACPPWVARPEVVIFEGEEQSRAVIEDYKPGQVDIYVDASVRNGRAGIGVYATPSQARISRTVASSDQADAHLTELLAISEAANWPWGPSCVALDGDGVPVPASSIRIFSDSQSALLSVQSWRASACQEVVAEIIKKLWLSNVVLYWIPGHSGIEGNEEADKLAKAATREQSEEPPQRDGKPWYLVRLALKKANIEKGSLPSGPPRRAETGKFTRKIDAALHLGKSAELYQQMNSAEAAILTQLRTGKTFLKEYLHKIKASETAACDCGLTESIAHFLFSCSRWVRQRAKLRRQHGERFGDLSYALGGYSNRQEGGENIDGPIERWKPDIDVVRATIEFAKDTGRLQPSEQDTASAEEEADERRQLRIPSLPPR
jgi:ribonuclease HI